MWTYDPTGRGNVTTDGAGNTYQYDEENRQIQFCSSSCITYSYDAYGRRVSATTTSGVTTYVYDAFGNLAMESGTQAATGAALCRTCYITTDQLGSTRVVTNESGCAVLREDYLPFGETVTTSTGNPRLSAGGGPFAGSRIWVRATGDSCGESA